MYTATANISQAESATFAAQLSSAQLLADAGAPAEVLDYLGASRFRS